MIKTIIKIKHLFFQKYNTNKNFEDIIEYKNLKDFYIKYHTDKKHDP